MYSRYVPNAAGGFERRRIPEASDLSRTQPAGRAERSAEPGPDSAPPPPAAPRRDAPPEPAAARRPGGPGPPRSHAAPGDRRLRPSGGTGLPGGAPLGWLLPRGLDAEDLLILAVLLLAMRQDGATGTELLIAAGIYLLF